MCCLTAYCIGLYHDVSVSFQISLFCFPFFFFLFILFFFSALFVVFLYAHFFFLSLLPLFLCVQRSPPLFLLSMTTYLALLSYRRFFLLSLLAFFFPRTYLWLLSPLYVSFSSSSALPWLSYYSAPLKLSRPEPYCNYI